MCSTLMSCSIHMTAITMHCIEDMQTRALFSRLT